MESGARRLVAELEHDGVAVRQRRRQLPDGDRSGEVPGGDQADNTNRPPAREEHLIRSRRLVHLARGAPALARREAQDRRGARRLPARLAERLAHLRSHVLGDALCALVERRRGRPEDRGAPLRRQSGPGRLCLGGRGYRVGRVGRRRRRECPGDEVGLPRAPLLVRAAGLAPAPLAADEDPERLAHAEPRSWSVTGSVTRAPPAGGSSPPSRAIRLSAPSAAELVAGHAHGRQRRIGELRELEVVETRHGDVVGNPKTADPSCLERAESEQVVAAHDRRRRIGELEQPLRHPRAVRGIPDPVRHLELGRRHSGGAQRLAVAAQALLDHRPRRPGRDERNPPVPGGEQMLGQLPRPGPVLRGHGDDRHAGGRLLEDDEAEAELVHAPDGPAPHRRRTREEQERAVDAVLEQRREEAVGVVGVGARSLDQQRVPVVAGDVADAGDDQVGHRVGEEARPLVEDEEAECHRPLRAQAPRSRVRPVAEPVELTADPLPRLDRHQVEAPVDVVRDRLQRDARLPGDVAHRRPAHDHTTVTPAYATSATIAHEESPSTSGRPPTANSRRSSTRAPTAKRATASRTVLASAKHRQQPRRDEARAAQRRGGDEREHEQRYEPPDARRVRFAPASTRSTR